MTKSAATVERKDGSKCERLTLKAAPTHVSVYSLLSVPLLFSLSFLLNSSVFPYLSLFLSLLLCERSLHQFTVGGWRRMRAVLLQSSLPGL